MNVVLKDNGEIRLEAHLDETVGVTLVKAVRDKLPERPDRSSNAWCDWDTQPGYCDVYLFFPFADWERCLDVISDDLEAVNEGTSLGVKERLLALASDA